MGVIKDVKQIGLPEPVESTFHGFLSGSERKREKYEVSLETSRPHFPDIFRFLCLTAGNKNNK